MRGEGAKTPHWRGFAGKLANDALGQLLADALGAGDRCSVTHGKRIHEFGGRDRVHNGHGRLASHARHILKAYEPGAGLIAFKGKKGDGAFGNPGLDMQLSFFEDNLPAITEMNSENYNAWTNNIIVLDKTSLGETAKILENWYDVDIEFADPSLKELTISGKFKEEKLETVLKSIALIKDLEVDHNNPKKIIIREQQEKFN